MPKVGSRGLQWPARPNVHKKAPLSRGLFGIIRNDPEQMIGAQKRHGFGFIEPEPLLRIAYVCQVLSCMGSPRSITFGVPSDGPSVYLVSRPLRSMG